MTPSLPAPRLLLDTTPGFTVVGEAGTGREAVRLAVARRPHVVLMGIRMPDLTGIDATEKICQGTGDTRVLILTTFDLDEYVYGALRAPSAPSPARRAPSTASSPG